ncbi:MAG TPA: diguanylate cyclase [Candidatus Competibacteraceae bacterium]|nr:diguanylate cyclase [Candidatus Competibacteraceae bacterium]
MCNKALAIPNVVEQSPAILTISVGVACCVPDAQTDADSLISRADKALYHAKAAGRNRVACAPSISRP